jgi:hypothetical protein
VYLFESKAAADRSRTTGLFAGLTGNPEFTNLTIREFHVLDVSAGAR